MAHEENERDSVNLFGLRMVEGARKPARITAVGLRREPGAADLSPGLEGLG